MSETCAIVPIKDFRRAKSRLRPVLNRSQCAEVARLLALDTLERLTSAATIDRVLVVGQCREQARLARRFGCDFVADDDRLDLSSNLTRIGRRSQQAGAGTLLYMPADLAFVTQDDISRLVLHARHDIAICRAIRDGGTNALVASPLGRFSFSFGANSSELHARAARMQQRSVRILDDPAFQRDIDVPEDLAALCNHGIHGNLADYLCNGRLAPMLARESGTPMAS